MDRELLEFAAKAAGIDLQWETPFVAIGDFAQFPHNAETGDCWDPLTDDGDALRLAVKLGILVSPNENGKTIAALPTDDDMVNHHMIERHGDDPYAATRRAIVRAAAEIGKEVK